MSEETKETPVCPEPTDNLITSKHSVTINGKKVNYTVTVGTMVVKQEVKKDGVYEARRRSMRSSSPLTPSTASKTSAADR